MTRRLLIVDDDGAMRQMLESLFREQGFTTEVADSVDAALERLRETVGDLPLGGVSGLGAPAPDESFLEDAAMHHLSLRDLEERYIDEVLRATGGNKVQAARILGIDRKTLYRRAERRRADEERATG